MISVDIEKGTDITKIYLLLLSTSYQTILSSIWLSDFLNTESSNKINQGKDKY